MPIQVDARFDSGNIEVRDLSDPAALRLAIRPDTNSPHLQWFHFRATGLEPGQPYRFVLENAGQATFNDGWPGYRAVASENGQDWFRVPTQYDGQALTIEAHPTGEALSVAYFEPYTRTRHAELIQRALAGGAALHAEGSSAQGRPIELLRAGSGPLAIWVIAQQHPGEHMAEWFMEGLMERLLDSSASSEALLSQATFYLIPNMNPDGAFLGHLRTNFHGVDLNRAWQDPDPVQAPEVYFAHQQMQLNGVDLFIDAHGDEAIPHVFTAACEGNPGYTPRLAGLESRFRDLLCEQTRDFQQVHGYPRSAPGKANPALACHAVGQRYDCLALTLEMPFKDHDDAPSPQTGWNGARSARLGGDVLHVISQLLGDLR
ncbi:M14 family metallopeptidase [Pseudomonas sp. KNUC1026]|uniref:M14 family metallopeptidase n=1 Tax=Pseudomonas sp. KNUC1026 TaxID=2893890 RepID=UPI001F2FF8E5|nr:M14-type cytosolic carboxypeptidase [Pseudomonas sp. KNUC1026]UFH50698.1 M14-type cytosolic carboxypeptidase [Pseudomonas sp. KNUC1026]